MIKIQKETVTKRYREDGIYVETIIQFHYDTETEKLNHSREMQKSGFEDSGQVGENVGDMLHPDYVWFGSYYKHIKVEDNVLPDMRELEERTKVLGEVKNDLQGRLDELI